MLYLCQQGQMFVTGENMHAGRDQQPLSYATRLPNEAQQDALRLLDSSRSVVNAALIKLWPKLDAFLHERRGPAWKHVVELIDSPDPHGNRQWRCEAETAGRIMRGQAERKQVFALIQPILSHGFIRPKTEHRAAGKNRKSSKEPITLTLPACVKERLKEGASMAPTLRELVKADGSRIAVLDVIVQVKKAPLAAWKTVERVLGFDWGVHGLITAVVLSTNPAEPDKPVQLSRPLFVNTGGLDGHQARTRRQIDALKAAREKLVEGDPKRAAYSQEINRCWWLYEARNRELAHLAANLLLLFAAVWGCSLISGESLKTLKSTGRGKGVRGRWRNWRNNTTIRSEIWHIVRYKSHLVGMRFRSE